MCWKALERLSGPLTFKKAWLAMLPHKKITSFVAATKSVMAFTAKSCKTCRTCKSSVGRSLSFAGANQDRPPLGHETEKNWNDVYA